MERVGTNPDAGMERFSEVSKVLRKVVARPLPNIPAHEQARLENDDALGRHRDFLPGLRVATPAGGALAHLEDPKIAKLNRLAGFQAFDDMVECALDDPLNFHLGNPGLLRNQQH